MGIYKLRFALFPTKFFFSCLILVAFFSCNSIDSVSCPPVSGELAGNISIQRINLYLDASGSMKGLMQGKGPRDFRTQVPLFMADLKNRFPASDIHFFIMESPTAIKEISFKEAEDELIPNSKISEWAGSTFIPEMLDSMKHRSERDTGTVNILITDGIYSPDNKDQLAQSPRKIYEVFDTSFATTIISVKSSYTQNAKTIQSPYYYFITGSNEDVKGVRNVLKTSYNNEYEVVNFGEALLHPYYTLIPYVDNTGGAEINHCSPGDDRYLVIKDLSTSRDFWLGIDLAAAPNYVTTDYVRTNIKITREGTSLEVLQVLNKDEFLKRLNTQDDKKLSEKCTHFIKFSLKKPPKNSEIQIKLNKISPAPWISSHSHQVQDSADSKRDATYGFEEIISGIERAYSAKKNEYFFEGLRLIVQKN